MNNELGGFDLNITDQTLYPILYTCLTCGGIKTLYQPLPREPWNIDHRQFCSNCKMIKNHIRTIPDIDIKEL